MNFPHKWPVTWKIFPFDDVITRSALGSVVTGVLLVYVVRATVGFTFQKSLADLNETLDKKFKSILVTDSWGISWEIALR